ncbi:MAG TPA: hypothetical protein VKE69_05600, partial [Planctomycetota bacterium]|nr:hypothetical protein [Planctomycetota bacterium]
MSERAARIALVALCLLAPAVFAAKAILRPNGDRFPKPAAIPAVPIVLVTCPSLSAFDLPNLVSLSRRAVTFERTVSAGNDDAAALASILCGALPRDHRVTDGAASLAADFPTLATILAGHGFASVALLGRPIARACGLDRGFADVRDAPTSLGAVQQLDSWLGESSPPRFFAWLDLAGAREEIDASIGAVRAMLRRRRIHEDVALLVVAGRGDGAPRTFDERAMRGAILVRLPYEKLAGTVAPMPI